MIRTEELIDLLSSFLVRQRWFGAKDLDIKGIRADHSAILKKDWPGLVQLIASVELQGAPSENYQILIGLRPAGELPQFLEGVPEAVIGEIDSDLGGALAYDALRDPELCKVLLQEVAAEDVEHVRPISGEQSNSSLIFDDRLILKIFRRLLQGSNPDVEVTRGLWEVGFHNVAEPIAEWRMEETDLAVLRKYLAGGSEGWALALTSLRDLFGSGGPPEEAGGDFAAEAARLGEMTANMHLSLAKAFGTKPGDPDSWASMMQAQNQEVRRKEIDTAAADEVFEELRDIDDPGPAIRVHGDYHLAQVMRTDEGWFVLDFEGEPTRHMDWRRKHLSPIKDVAGMIRSFQYAARAALSAHDDDVIKLAQSWETRNRQAFLDGYVAVAHSGGIIPSDVASVETLIRAFELDKAIYEVAYESAHRPDWVHIPLDAIHRLLGEKSTNGA